MTFYDFIGAYSLGAATVLGVVLLLDGWERRRGS